MAGCRHFVIGAMSAGAVAAGSVPARFDLTAKANAADTAAAGTAPSRASGSFGGQPEPLAGQGYSAGLALRMGASVNMPVLRMPGRCRRLPVMLLGFSSGSGGKTELSREAKRSEATEGRPVWGSLGRSAKGLMAEGASANKSISPHINLQHFGRMGRRNRHFSVIWAPQIDLTRII
jgi:hypothetical protein